MAVLSSAPPDEDPILRPDDLMRPFTRAFKERKLWRVGTEAEKFGVVVGPQGPRPADFKGPQGVQAILRGLADRYGWTPQREHAQGEIIYLTRGATSITLEPAAQLELSGAPYFSIHDTAQEFEDHRRELCTVSEPLDVVWLSMGFHPFASHAELPHVPKLRYAIMKRYMPTRGARSTDMMRRTCTVQANLDYESGADAMRKLRLTLALQPIATAIFANSPFIDGVRGKHVTERAAVWLEMDRDRSGLLPFAWDRSTTLDNYVQWALDVPMFVIKRGARLLENTGQTFRAFMRDGFQGARATLEDWNTHLNSLFPEARLKGTLEVRGADALPPQLACAVPALWKGLLYDPEALGAAEALAEPLTHDVLQAARPAIAREALAADLMGRPLQHWAQRVLEIAHSGLQRLAVPGPDGQCDETRYLSEITTMVARGQTPADLLLERFQEPAPSREAMISATRI